MDRLHGLRVAVTGGTSGLGLAIVRESSRRGACVAFVARGRARVDVSLKDDIYPIAVQIVGELGGLDVLVNNASDLGPERLRLLADTDCEDLERALAVNLIGPFRLTKAVLGALAASAREGRGAVVVNVSSDAAVSAYPTWGAYGASKAALRHLSAIWDAELEAEGVRVLSPDPGDMDTPLHAQAVPDADRSVLGRPEAAALELLDAIAAALPVAPPRPDPDPDRGVSPAGPRLEAQARTS
jgi:NAD(P)-dependent dehydrogenase (short-subunit alcohol dehydrogenase family)